MADSGIFGFEYIVNFSALRNGNQSINGGDQKPLKQLACRRCHTQKLCSVRKSPNVHTCDRCLTAHFECIARRVQRMGRPVDHNDNTKNGVQSQPKSRYRSQRNRNAISSAIG
ncbi:hypothetical protein B0O99DRAFT_680737 [Bisporella sp. PMI_857]|nr:hypothetical protein B0O99DRAFT_680737 [Bisporella sp. PMI_857]